MLNEYVAFFRFNDGYVVVDDGERQPIEQQPTEQPIWSDDVEPIEYEDGDDAMRRDTPKKNVKVTRLGVTWKRVRTSLVKC